VKNAKTPTYCPHYMCFFSSLQANESTCDSCLWMRFGTFCRCDSVAQKQSIRFVCCRFWVQFLKFFLWVENFLCIHEFRVWAAYLSSVTVITRKSTWEYGQSVQHLRKQRKILSTSITLWPLQQKGFVTHWMEIKFKRKLL